MTLPPKVLVLCEDKEVRTALKQSLKRCHVRGVYCRSTVALRRALAAHAGDAVVYAGEQPGSKLRDVMEWPEIRAARVPVIAVSRSGEIHDYLAAMEAGAFDYMARPLQCGELSRIVMSAVDQGRAA